jgi:uncharacterized membrane-anchored protein
VSVKKRGETYFNSRGSNKKYPQLDDIDKLAVMSLTTCPADIARELNVPPNCVRYMMDKYFTPEQKANSYWKRRRNH